jgi:hypothetical protein
MLRSMRSSIPIASPSIRLDISPRRMRQVMIAAIQLLQILLVNQPPIPQESEQLEIWSRRPQCLSAHSVFQGQVLHAHIPGHPSELGRRFPVAQWALYRLRWLFTTEVRTAMDLPLLPVLRDIPAVQEPERAFKHGCSELRTWYFKYPIMFLQQRHARKVTGESSADTRFGGCRFGVGAVRTQ